MNRLKGHVLRRLPVEPKLPDKAREFQWECECGVTFGKRSVHNARKVWREHKDALSDGGVA